jgi:PAS domain S-box-containing protein
MDGVLTASLDGKIFDANEAASRILHYTHAEFGNLGCSALFAGNQETFSEVLATCAKAGLFRGEAILLRQGGERFTAHLAAASFLDDCGMPQMHLVIRDHSEHERLEAVLRSNAMRYQTITGTTPDGCWEVDEQGRIVEVNDRCCSQYGYSRDELLKLTVHDFEAVRNPAETAAHIQEILNFGHARFETRHRCKDGRILEVEVSTTYQPNNRRFIAFLRDITARKQAEVLLRETEERYRGLVESAFNGIVLHRDGIILAANAAYAATFGYTMDELAGRRVQDVVTPEAWGEVAEVLRDGSERSYVTIGLRKDGSQVPIEVSGKKCMVDGKTARIAAVRDLTEQRQADEEKEKLRTQLNHAQKMESVGRLAGGVAHDFNNMLTAIQCNVSLAFDRLPPGAALRENLDQILLCTRRSADLTRQLLAFARKQTIDPQVLDLNAAVAGLLKMMQRIIGEDIELVWRPAANLGAVTIDPSQLDQLLANLCVNARDAIQGVGTITLEVENRTIDAADCAAHPAAVPGDYVTLAVSDTGCGMNAEVKAHLFEPFFTTKKLGEGTGLGLATIHGIVIQNGGFIDVESTEGKGTTFTLLLPRTAVATPPPRPLPASDDALPRGHETILLVEDEAHTLKVEGLVLKSLGYRVLAADRPSAALHLAATHVGKIDLLLTDVVLPEMNGRELAQNLLVRDPSLRVLFASGYTANTFAPQGVIDPGMHFIQKPFTPKVLADKIRMVLDGGTVRAKTQFSAS